MSNRVALLPRSSRFSRSATLLLGLTLASGLAACSDDDDGDVGDAQTPPTKGAEVETWLAGGMYKTWKSEPAVHAARMPSPHGFNRIFVNDALASAAAGTGPFPMGSASVKELYDSATATTPIGYAVSLKLAADSGAGANWYWYERFAGPGVVADGMGDAGPAKTICVSCHNAAGADADHTPSPGARDQVYTPVR
jgi:Cytochrome P460